MLDMGPIGWIVVGFVAGWLSGLVVHDGGARGCLPNILIGIFGGLIGGWLARELRLGDPAGFTGAVIVAFLGAVMVRLILASMDGRQRRW